MCGKQVFIEFVDVYMTKVITHCHTTRSSAGDGGLLYFAALEKRLFTGGFSRGL